MQIRFLPSEYYDLVKERIKTSDIYFKGIDHLVDQEIRHNFSCLDIAFTWGKTSEGSNFWFDVFNAQKVEDLPPLPSSVKRAIEKNYEI